MLDDAQLIQKLDRSNALGVITGQAGQLKHTYDFDAPKIHRLDNIVVAAMGGSALGAEFLRAYLGNKLPIPMTIVRDYDLPKFVGPQTLVICSSYSGNTEETLSALEAAKASGAVVAVLTAGGKLQEAAEHEGLVRIQLPGGFQPRMTVLYQVKALATLLEKLGLISGIGVELEAVAEWAVKHAGTWSGDVPTANNLAKQVAEKLAGKAVVVYGGPTLAMLAQKLKIDLNENAKNIAFYYAFPEFNHNEFNGWLFAPKDSMAAVELQSHLDHPQVHKRFEVSNRLLSGKLPKPIIIQAEGDTKLQQMVWCLTLGGIISVYAAFINGVDPTPVDLVERMKKELA